MLAAEPEQIVHQQVATYRRRSLADWCAAHGQPHVLLHPGYEKLLPLLNGKPNEHIARPSTFYGRVTDAVVLPRKGFICTNDGHLIYEGLSYRDQVSALSIGGAFAGKPRSGEYEIGLPADIPIVERECIYFGGEANFGHFIFENLLGVAVAARIPNVDALPLAVASDLPKRVFEFFDLAGWPASRRIEIDPERPTRFACVWHHSAPLR